MTWISDNSGISAQFTCSLPSPSLNCGRAHSKGGLLAAKTAVLLRLGREYARWVEGAERFQIPLVWKF